MTETLKIISSIKMILFQWTEVVWGIIKSLKLFMYEARFISVISVVVQYTTLVLRKYDITVKYGISVAKMIYL